jgi:hypothetical protein
LDWIGLNWINLSLKKNELDGIRIRIDRFFAEHFNYFMRSHHLKVKRIHMIRWYPHLGSCKLQLRFYKTPCGMLCRKWAKTNKNNRNDTLKNKYHHLDWFFFYRNKGINKCTCYINFIDSLHPWLYLLTWNDYNPINWVCR